MDERFSERRTVAFQDDPFLLDLTDESSTWWSAEGADMLLVVAVQSYGGYQWAAYYESPQWGPLYVKDFGNKIPEDAARRLFPGEPWANLEYRR